MPALLTSIIFDEKTKDALMESMAAHQDAEHAQEMIEILADLRRDAVKMQHLPDGAYTLIIKMDLEKSTVAQLTLMESETHDVIKQTTFDLQPVIETSLLYLDDYADALSDSLADPSKAKQKEADARIDAIHNLRTAPLDTILSPYIVNNDAFNNELLEALDFATRCYIEDKILDDGHTPEVKSALSDPLNKNLSGSKLLN